MPKHSSIGEFDSDRETWKLYTEHLIQYFAANIVESASKQCAIFLTELVTLVKQHRNRKPSVIVQWFNLNMRMKQPGETIAAYTAELRKIAEHCSFGDSLDDMLRDHSVCGINDTALQRRLLAEPELSYQTAFKMV